MELEEAIILEFQSVVGLTTTVYMLVAPQGTKGPYLVISPSRASNETLLSGVDILKETEIQIDYYHSTYSNLKALKKLVALKIQSFNFRIVGINGPYIQQVEIFNQFETFENTVPIYKGIIEIKIYTKED